ncbi:DUF4199 domain-containing protein [Chitinophaga arvensicola]|uniref:DUF4199 domain-containing protein n=1 Tax=Chitinophaga arvensicola TaxID=29529 RepID=A0A1I0NVG2_9BACT|nr:DUF4199 domain-containing protein [Chitinophaga arvensicola]SEW05649.1 hypothetical protein SAMN04488122_0395 [Chitinophaga arvensicola]
MEKPLSSKALPAYGFILGVIAIVFTLIFYVTKLYGNLWMGYFGNLIMFLGVLISIIHYNRIHKDKTSAMSAFSMGLRTTIIATILYAAFLLIFHLVVGGTPSQGLQEEDTVKDNFWIYFLGNAIFVNLLVGVVAAVLGAMVFKSNQKTDKSKAA